MSSPKTLFIDIETAPILAKVWSLWKNDVALNQIENDWYIMAFAANWFGSDKVIYMDNRKNGDDDTKLLKAMWKLLNKADYVVGHNGRRFDCPKINARFIQKGILPPAPYKVIDTLDVAKRSFNFTSNKLEYLAKALGCTPKLTQRKYSGMELWNGCLRNDKEAWNEMKHYNIQDTLTLKEVFLKLRPWMTNQLNYNLFNSPESEPVCRVCGSDKLVKNGNSYTALGKFQRYLCNNCGSWSRSTNRVGKSNITGVV